jgi:hypothetical protein
MPADEAGRAGDEVAQRSSRGLSRGVYVDVRFPARNTSTPRSVETGWRFDATGLRGGPCARMQRRSEPFHSAVALISRHSPWPWPRPCH